MPVKEECLTIRLTRLPDIHTEQAVASHGLLRYGRFVLMREGGFWFAHTISSHPSKGYFMENSSVLSESWSIPRANQRGSKLDSTSWAISSRNGSSLLSGWMDSHEFSMHAGGTQYRMQGLGCAAIPGIKAFPLVHQLEMVGRSMPGT